MAKVGFINGSFTVLELVVDPQATLDSAIQFSESTSMTPLKWRIGNFQTDDSFRISQGDVLGTDDALIVTPSRAILLPDQPAFQVYNDTVVPNVTGDATNFIITFNTVDYDVGAGFVDPDYTAPEDGIYLFSASIVLSGIDSGHTAGQLYMKSSTGETQYGVRLNPFAMSDSGNLAIEANGMFRLAQGDSVALTLQVSNGTKTVNVFGAALTAEPSSFQGFLLG